MRSVRRRPKRQRPGSIRKTRSLNPSYGDRVDNKYYAWSTGGYQWSSAVLQDVINNPDPTYQDGRSKAATTVTNTTGIGTEVLESTTRKKPEFNSCLHTKERAFNIPYLMVTKDWPEYLIPGWQRYGWVKYYRRPSSGTIANVANLVIPSWNDGALDEIRRRAWWAMQPRFESELSLLNFIYELKDFRSLAVNLMKMARGQMLGKLWQLRSTLVRMSKMQQAEKGLRLAAQAGKVPAGVSKVWADAWLQLQFAIKPLISDLNLIYEACCSVEDAVQAEFASRGEDAQNSHYTEPLREKMVGTWGSNSQRMFFTGSRARTTLTCTLRYKYELKLRSGWELVRRVWGLDLNAEVIWNALPFSFLVDYFYQVGKAIRNMQLDDHVKPAYLAYCESLNSELFYGTLIDTADSLIVKFYAPCLNQGKDLKLGYTPVSGSQATWYNRRIDLAPNKGAALPRLKGPSKTQLFNIAALIRSMVG